MKEKQVIVTEHGLEIERLTWLDKIAGHVGLKIAKALDSEGNRLPKALIEDLKEFQEVQQIQQDFEKGRIRGRIVLASDPSVHNFTPDETRLALAEYHLMQEQNLS